MKKYAGLCCLAVLLAMQLSGCGVQQAFQGQFYLSLENYEDGVASFREKVRETPRDPTAHYYLGRYLLALGNSAEAEAELGEAVKLDPMNKDGWFWLGVARGVRGETEGERKAYAKALRLDKDHLQSLIYMGHNRLEAGALAEALEFYDRSLKIWPRAPEPLFNRALIFKRLQRRAEAHTAFELYLAHYASGAEAIVAADELNALGTFEYRNHLLGKRRVTLTSIEFEPLTAKVSDESMPSLKLVAEVLKNNPRLTLHVLAYQDGNRALAKKRALAVREAILTEEPALGKDRVRGSWFGVPEKVEAGGTTHLLLESISLFAVEAR